MRAPPPVEYPSSLGRVWRGALSLLVGACVAVPLAWSLPRVAALGDTAGLASFFAPMAEPMVQGGLALVLAALGCVGFWLISRPADTSEDASENTSDDACERTLRWDGQAWTLADGGDSYGREGDVALMLDLGPWMLVRFVPSVGRPGARARRARWLTFTLGRDAARWAALRGALWTWRASATPGP